jgi:hypothetical protein
VNKRALGIFAVFLLLVGLVTVQVVSTVTKPVPLPPAVTLPDGSTLRLVSVGYGTEHFLPGKWWQRYARHLPLAWQSRLPMASGPAMTTSVPSLGLWLDWDKLDPNVNWDFALADEHDVEARLQPSATANSFAAGTTGPRSGFMGRAFTTFPRRSATMELRLYEPQSGGGRVLLASFRFPNPVREKFPEWKPLPLPATVKHGDLEITLERLSFGASQDHPWRPAKTSEESHALGEFHVTDRGALGHWVPDGVQMSDATGNELRARSWSRNILVGRPNYLWNPHLWPSEAAWKLQFDFSRSEGAYFSTNELFEVPALAVPPMDGATESSFTTNRLGHTLRVPGLAQGSWKFPGRKSSLGTADRIRLEVEVSPDLGRKRLTVVRASDDQGRSLKGWMSGRHEHAHYFAYEVQPDAKFLNFTVAIHEVITAEFLVKPEPFVPAKAGPP